MSTHPVQIHHQHYRDLELLALAWATTVEGAANALLSEALRRTLTDRQIEVGLDRQRRMVRTDLGRPEDAEDA